ncbi:uncharacterized protein TNCV_1938491 [Trichonephila clavipes]|nr:uncharacterized protein TNCV_1938491 [Trichonephila clavipes]
MKLKNSTSTQIERSFRKMAARLLHGRLLFTFQTLIKIEIFFNPGLYTGGIFMLSSNLYTGPGCTQHYDPCYPNPCQNGGSCWPSLDSYFCSCNPGFTGDLCEEAMVAAQPLPRTLEDPGEPDEKGNSDHHKEALDRWHNMYMVGTILCLSASLVALIAVVCHCRLNKTYQRFTRKISRSCSDLKQQKLPRQVFIESSWERF